LGPPFSAPLENAYQFSSRVTGAEISTEKRTMKMGGVVNKYDTHFPIFHHSLVRPIQREIHGFPAT